MFFCLMFLISVEEMNRLMSKGMSKIKSHFWEKPAIWKKFSLLNPCKNWRSQNFDFLSSKNLSLGQFLKSSNLRRYHWILKFLVAIEKSEVWEQNFVWLFYDFHYERNCDVLKSKSPYILLKKSIKTNENKTESRMENPTNTFRETCLIIQHT